MRGKIVKTTLLSLAAIFCMSFITIADPYADIITVHVKDSEDDTIDYGDFTIDRDYGEFTDSAGTVYSDINPFPLTKEGYVFDGFYDAKVGGNKCITGNSIMTIGIMGISDGSTLYIRFVPGVYKIFLKINDGDKSWDPVAMGSEKVEIIYEKYGEGFYRSKNCEAADLISKLPGTRTWAGIVLPETTVKSFAGYYDSVGGTQYIDEDGEIRCSNTTFTSDTTLEGVWDTATLAIPIERNDGSGSLVDTIYVKYEEGFYSDSSCTAGTLLTDLSDARYMLTRKGYDFKGYAIDETGSKMYVDENGTFDSTNMKTDDRELLFKLKLYAVWEETRTDFTINYNNKKAPSSPDTDAAYTLRGEEIYRDRVSFGAELYDKTTNKFAMPLSVYYPNQNIFDGYYDAALGGNQYVDKDGNIIDDSIFSYTGILYAHWAPKVFEISIAKNDGTANLITKVYSKFEEGIYNEESLSTKTEKIATVSWAGHRFMGYNSDQDGEGIDYADENGVIDPANFNASVFYSNKTIFAKWKENIFTFQLKVGTTLLQDLYIFGENRASSNLNSKTDKITSIDISSLSLPEPPTEDEIFGGFVVKTASDEIPIIDEKGKILDTVYLFASGADPTKGLPMMSTAPAMIPLVTAVPSTTLLEATVKWIPKPVTPPSSDGRSSGGTSGGSGGSGGGGGTATTKGTSLAGWQKIGNTWYYFLSTGTTYKGWICENAKDFYYLDPEASGAMATGYRIIDGYLYYFKDTGVMAKTEFINDVFVDNTGAIAKVEKYCKAENVGFDKTYNKFYLLDKDNQVITDSVVTYKGYIYVASPIKYANGISELLCGNCNVGDIVLYFDGNNGGYLNNIFKKKDNTLVSYTVKDAIRNDLVIR